MVGDSSIAKKVNYNKEYLYCLITDTHKIPINNTLFSDYFDYHIDQKNVQNNVLSKLNGYFMKNHYSNFPIWAFHKNTLIDTPTSSKKIKDFNIGDKTCYGEVLGLIKVKVDNVYKYNNVITTGDQIVISNGAYIRVKDIPSAKRVEVKDNEFYHLADSSYKLFTNGKIFTDFLQCPE